MVNFQSERVVLNTLTTQLSYTIKYLQIRQHWITGTLLSKVVRKIVKELNTLVTLRWFTCFVLLMMKLKTLKNVRGGEHKLSLDPLTYF